MYVETLVTWCTTLTKNYKNGKGRLAANLTSHLCEGMAQDQAVYAANAIRKSQHRLVFLGFARLRLCRYFSVAAICKWAVSFRKHGVEGVTEPSRYSVHEKRRTLIAIPTFLGYWDECRSSSMF